MCFYSNCCALFRVETHYRRLRQTGHRESRDHLSRERSTTDSEHNMWTGHGKTGMLQAQTIWKLEMGIIIDTGAKMKTSERRVRSFRRYVMPMFTADILADTA